MILSVTVFTASHPDKASAHFKESVCLRKAQEIVHVLHSRDISLSLTLCPLSFSRLSTCLSYQTATSHRHQMSRSRWSINITCPTFNKATNQPPSWWLNWERWTRAIVRIQLRNIHGVTVRVYFNPLITFTRHVCWHYHYTEVCARTVAGYATHCGYYYQRIQRQCWRHPETEA